VRFSHRAAVKLDNPKWRDRIVQLVAQDGIRFVLVDSLSKCMQGDENSARDMNKVFDTLDAIRNAGATVMYLDHLHKPQGEEEDIDNQGRGSSSKAGVYDTHDAFRPVSDDDENTVRLIVRSRDEEEHQFNVVWQISKEQGRADLYMERHNPNEAPSNEVVAACLEKMKAGTVYKLGPLLGLWKMPKQMAGNVLKVLEESGTVTRTPSGGWKREL
jgi:hypothetical protein